MGGGGGEVDSYTLLCRICLQSQDLIFRSKISVQYYLIMKNKSEKRKKRGGNNYRRITKEKENK